MTTLPVRYGDHERADPDTPCSVCGSIGRIRIDHCHAHGWVRGPVCPGCNALMAMIDRGRVPGESQDQAGILVESLIAQAARCHECPPVEANDLTRNLRSGRVMSVNLPDDVHAVITAHARSQQRSFSGQVIWTLRRQLATDGALPDPTATDGTPTE